VVAGQTINPESGIDAQFKRHLKGVLEELKVDPFHPRQSRRRALERLDDAAVRHVHLVVSSWISVTTPEAFLQRHRTGAKFGALPQHVQEQALDKLRTWAKVTFGSLDTQFAETRSFEIDIYGF
jgi:hypothetical protein